MQRRHLRIIPSAGIVEDGVREYPAIAEVDVGSRVDFLIGPGTGIGVMRFTATLRDEW